MDSYERFFSKGYITKEDFFEFGLSETIYAPIEKAEAEWAHLKHRIQNNQQVFIRGFGRNASGTHLYQSLYKNILNNENIATDPTNNAQPTKLIRNLTGYSKTKNSKYNLIKNYQISHIFGRTKNVFAFTAPWNIVYTPKIVDPFTGHEAKGVMIDEYQKLFQQQSFNYFEKFIDDYNKIITNTKLVSAVSQYLDKIECSQDISERDIEKLKKSVAEEFSPITA